MTLDILQYPDERLQTVCPVDRIGPETAQLIEDMFVTMYAAQGRGLAAPQVGVLRRVFVMDAGWKSGEKTPKAYVHPEIIAASGRVSGPEGCLSAPGVMAQVERYAEITVTYLDSHAVRHTEDLTGFEAICAQHEIDHLDGKMHFDRLERQARLDLIAEYEAML